MEGWGGDDEKEDEEEEDEDGGEAAHHPDAHVQKEKWYEAQKLSTKRFFFSHIVRLAVQYLLDRIISQQWHLIFRLVPRKTSSKERIARPWGQNLFTPKPAQLGNIPREPLSTVEKIDDGCQKLHVSL